LEPWRRFSIVTAQEVNALGDKSLHDYDRVFVDSIVEEINEMMIEKYADDDTVPILGVCGKDELPGDMAIWVHVFKIADIKEKLGK
jgi:hypothetical protein